jgi:hypothetical protein
MSVSRGGSWVVGLAIGLGLAAGIGTRPVKEHGGPAVNASPVVAEEVGNTALPGDAVQRAMVDLRTCRSLREFVRLGPLLEKLDNAQMSALLTALETERHLAEQDFLPVLLDWWTRRNARAATAWLEPQLRRYLREEKVTDTLTAWAKAAPANALEYLRSSTNRRACADLLQTVIDAWPDKGPEARLKVLQDLPKGVARGEVMVSVAGAWLEEVDEDLEEKVPMALQYFDEEEKQRVLAARFSRDARACFGFRPCAGVWHDVGQSLGYAPGKWRAGRRTGGCGVAGGGR